MFSAISRRIRILGCQSTAANSIRIRSFNTKAPRFNEKSLQQSSEQSGEQPHEEPHEQPHEQSAATMRGPLVRRTMQPHEQSAVTMQRPLVRRTMQPVHGAGRIPSTNVIACILEEEMDEILLGNTRYLYRKFFFNEATRYVWLYVKRPVAKLSYVAEIGSCKLVPHELPMLPYYNNRRVEALDEARVSREIRIVDREVGEGTVDGGTGALPRMTFYAGDLKNFDVPGLPRYAFLIRRLWEITWPTHGVTCEELWERRFLQSPPPPKYIIARDQMLLHLPLGRQKVLF